MPAKTRKQMNFMRLCSTHPEKAQKPCPSKRVAKKFTHMDHE